MTIYENLSSTTSTDGVRGRGGSRLRRKISGLKRSKSKKLKPKLKDSEINGQLAASERKSKNQRFQINVTVDKVQVICAEKPVKPSAIFAVSWKRKARLVCTKGQQLNLDWNDELPEYEGAIDYYQDLKMIGNFCSCNNNNDKYEKKEYKFQLEKINTKGRNRLVASGAMDMADYVNVDSIPKQTVIVLKPRSMNYSSVKLIITVSSKLAEESVSDDLLSQVSAFDNLSMMGSDMDIDEISDNSSEDESNQCGGSAISLHTDSHLSARLKILRLARYNRYAEYHKKDTSNPADSKLGLNLQTSRLAGFSVDSMNGSNESFRMYGNSNDEAVKQNTESIASGGCLNNNHILATSNNDAADLDMAIENVTLACETEYALRLHDSNNQLQIPVKSRQNIDDSDDDATQYNNIIEAQSQKINLLRRQLDRQRKNVVKFISYRAQLAQVRGQRDLYLRELAAFKNMAQSESKKKSMFDSLAEIGNAVSDKKKFLISTNSVNNSDVDSSLLQVKEEEDLEQVKEVVAWEPQVSNDIGQNDNGCISAKGDVAVVRNEVELLKKRCIELQMNNLSLKQRLTNAKKMMTHSRQKLTSNSVAQLENISIQLGLSIDNFIKDSNNNDQHQHADNVVAELIQTKCELTSTNFALQEIEIERRELKSKLGKLKFICTEMSKLLTENDVRLYGAELGYLETIPDFV